MKLHSEFEWDSRKAATNLKKHGITFDDAAAVLGDEDGDTYHVEEHDDEHSMGEDRSVTTGSHPADRSIILRIVWAYRNHGKKQVTRIISARFATSRERTAYVEEIASH
jgi:uncharacterized DUF497 family protein